MPELDGIDVLAECIEAVEDGRLTIAECLSRYPQHRENLEALLPLAVSLRHSPEIAPSPAFRHDARQRLLKQLPQHPRQLPFWSRLGEAISSLYLMQKIATLSGLTILILIVFALGTGGLIYAADGAAPGDVLYGLDHSLETLQLNLVSPATAVRLRQDYAEERLLEKEELLTRGDERHAEMAQESYDVIMATVEAIQKQDNPIVESPDKGRPATGHTAIITTTTPTPSPTVTPTMTSTAVTPTPTMTASPTATVSPTVTFTPTITATPTVTATPTITLTITPTVTLEPTATPTIPATVVAGGCTGANPHPQGTTLSNQLGVPYAEIMGWFCSGFGFGEIEQAYALSAETGVLVNDIFALRASGLGWGQIRQQLLANNNDANNQPDNNSNGDNNNNGNGNNNSSGNNGNGGNNNNGNGGSNNGNNGNGGNNNGNNGNGGGNNNNGGGNGNGNNGNNGNGGGNNNNGGGNGNGNKGKGND